MDQEGLSNVSGLPLHSQFCEKHNALQAFKITFVDWKFPIMFLNAGSYGQHILTCTENGNTLIKAPLNCIWVI